MQKTYTTYEAKAKFSEILRYVREGATVTVSYHGEPVAEIRPVGEPPTSLRRRLKQLEERGLLVRLGERGPQLTPVKRSRGALTRFLDDRGE